MMGMFNPNVESMPNGTQLVYSKVPRYWGSKGPSHNQGFYAFGSKTNIKNNFAVRSDKKNEKSNSG